MDSLGGRFAPKREEGKGQLKRLLTVSITWASHEGGTSFAPLEALGQLAPLEALGQLAPLEALGQLAPLEPPPPLEPPLEPPEKPPPVPLLLDKALSKLARLADKLDKLLTAAN
jgi:hypothetical protein